MNETLWNKVLQFNLDDPAGGYSFSVRLASENRWTKDFTEKAIVEYKKFMFLAAKSELMVSPSAIVDIVWHQHLIFSQSYFDFCVLLGKNIQHIPSTHDKARFDEFKKAAERTEKLYADHFGKQPESIWLYDTMLDGLKLKPAKLKIGLFTLFGVLGTIILSFPFYYLLRPIYIHINNPYFIWGLLGLTLPVCIILYFYTMSRFKEIAASFDSQSFVYHLKPFEVIYLKNHKLDDVINGSISELIHVGMIRVDLDQRICISDKMQDLSGEQLQVISTLKEKGDLFYTQLLRQLRTKPVFRNTAKSMDQFRSCFNQSREFAKLFYVNFIVFAVLVIFPLIRLVTGVLRDKPVFQVALLLTLLILFAINYLYKLNRQFFSRTIPGLYKEIILPIIKEEQDWRWDYFLYGSAVLSSSLIPLVNYKRSDATYASGDGGGGDSSCGSSGGSSCGSCGGCGGD
ncbi:hypothetical protein ACFSR6_06695 [Pedobacter vanadiisoli]|uniref:TIGR04222 domain-containing protein n=1 Tax=Pedobacter vanadiisoli TaxID=1761975 RepID=A0ABW5MHP5_9SPHI